MPLETGRPTLGIVLIMCGLGVKWMFPVTVSEDFRSVAFENGKAAFPFLGQDGDRVSICLQLDAVSEKQQQICTAAEKHP